MFKFLVIDVLRRTNVVFSFYRLKKEYAQSAVELLKEQKKRLNCFIKKINNISCFSGFIEQDSNSSERFKETLVMDKEFISNNFNNILHSKPVDYEHNYTGGSTGSPFHYLLSKKSLSRSKAFNYYLWNKFLGYKFGDKILVIGGSSLGSNTSFAKRIYNYLQNKIFIPGDIVDDSSKNLTVLMDGSYRFIYGYPSSLLNYISVANQKSLVFNKTIKGIITTSEMLYDNDKERIEAFFNTKVLNIYGANDGGVIAGSIDNESFLYNGLDCFVQDFQQSIEHEKELLLTNFNSAKFPFVRYRVGDVGEISYDYPNYPFVIKNIKGRSRDFFQNRKGVKFHGSLINKILKGFNFIDQYQLHQQKNYNIILYVKTEKETQLELYSEEIKQRLISILSDDSIDVSVEYTRSIKLNSNNKVKIIISDVV